MVMTRAGGKSVPPRPTRRKAGKEFLQTELGASSRLTRSKPAVEIFEDGKSSASNGKWDSGTIGGWRLEIRPTDKAVGNGAEGVAVTSRVTTRSNSIFETAGAEALHEMEVDAFVTVGKFTPESHGECWTFRQIESLRSACSNVRPSPQFWHLVAKQVSGKAAADCKAKFYSERSGTRSAKRPRVEDDKSTEKSSLGALQKNAEANVKPNARNPNPKIRNTLKEPMERTRLTEMAGRPAATSVRRTSVSLSRDTKGLIKAAKPIVKGQKSRRNAPDQSKATLHSVGTRGVNPSAGQVKSEPCERDFCNDRGWDASGRERDKEVESTSDLEQSAEKRSWTHAQETDLRNAYATIRPSINFWHEIAKKVSGRTAKECFDKFYSSHPTPPPPSARMRIRPPERVQSPPSPTLDARITTKRSKQRVLEAHRAVRRILRKQRADDQNYEADAFAALERPDVVQSVLETVDEQEATPNFSEVKQTDAKIIADKGKRGNAELGRGTQCLDMSDKENVRPGLVSNRMPIASAHIYEGSAPQVLKKVSDPGMLDRYIDHLHNRHTSGRTVSHGRGSKKSVRSNALHDSNSLHQQQEAFTRIPADVIKRAKEELKSVISRSGKGEGNLFGKARMDDSDEDSDDSEGSQITL